MIRELLYAESRVTDPYYNLAMEEFLLNRCGEGQSILYLWQNRNTVVIGKNQNAWKECRIEAIQKAGGYIARRLSGGGAVYHDTGNLNFTFITGKQDYDVTRNLKVICRAVSRFGIEARITGRNDLEAEGQKFSGNAFHKGTENCCHHGTLMVQVDLSKLSEYLNVSGDKLRSKGVASVRSRVVNLGNLSPDMTIEGLKEALREAFSCLGASSEEALPLQTISISEADEDVIHALAEKYASREWVFGRKISFESEIGTRFPWGEIQLLLQVNGGVICDAAMYSDALFGRLEEKIPPVLKGVSYEKEVMAEALRRIHPEGEKESIMLSDILQYLNSIEL
ncbi:MAG: lipoate--protein ligase [Lachnospiraceae bacterium]|nr:lipoate--protein ligase [Lachnospiraceae bacterium]